MLSTDKLSWILEYVKGCIAFCRYENLIQVRCLLDGMSTEDILSNWHTILPERMNKWQQTREEVPALFHIF